MKFEPEIVPNLGEVAAPRRRAAIVHTTPYDPNSLYVLAHRYST